MLDNSCNWKFSFVKFLLVNIKNSKFYMNVYWVHSEIENKIE